MFKIQKKTLKNRLICLKLRNFRKFRRLFYSIIYSKAMKKLICSLFYLLDIFTFQEISVIKVLVFVVFTVCGEKETSKNNK